MRQVVVSGAQVGGGLVEAPADDGWFPRKWTWVFAQIYWTSWVTFTHFIVLLMIDVPVFMSAGNGPTFSGRTKSAFSSWLCFTSILVYNTPMLMRFSMKAACNVVTLIVMQGFVLYLVLSILSCVPSNYMESMKQEAYGVVKFFVGIVYHNYDQVDTDKPKIWADLADLGSVSESIAEGVGAYVNNSCTSCAFNSMGKYDLSNHLFTDTFKYNNDVVNVFIRWPFLTVIFSVSANVIMQSDSETGQVALYGVVGMIIIVLAAFITSQCETVDRDGKNIEVNCAKRQFQEVYEIWVAWRNTMLPAPTQVRPPGVSEAPRDTFSSYLGPMWSMLISTLLSCVENVFNNPSLRLAHTVCACILLSVVVTIGYVAFSITFLLPAVFFMNIAMQTFGVQIMNMIAPFFPQGNRVEM